MLVLPLLEIIRSFDCEFNEDESLICYNNKEFQNIIDIYNTPFSLSYIPRYFKNWDVDYESRSKFETVTYHNPRSTYIVFERMYDPRTYAISNSSEERVEIEDSLISHTFIRPEKFNDFVNDMDKMGITLTWNQRSVEKIKSVPYLRHFGVWLISFCFFHF